MKKLFLILVLGLIVRMNYSNTSELDLKVSELLQKYVIKLELLEEEIIELLSNKTSLTASEIRKKLQEKVNVEHIKFALRILDLKGVLVRTYHRYITDNLTKYGLMAEWLPDITSDEIHTEENLKVVMLKYIKKFGPVCLDDLCWWFPLQKTIAAKTVANL